MLPSKGYFTNLSCPFFEIDSCGRPHCHFKHSKKDKDLVSGTVNEIKDTEKKDSLIKQLVKETVKQVLNHSEIRESNESIIDTTSIVDDVVSNLSNPNLNNPVTTTSVTNIGQTANSTPSYRPTPISELSRRHIPVQYAPAKPTCIRTISRKRSDKPVTYIPTLKTESSNDQTDLKSTLNPLVSAYIPTCTQQPYEPEYLPTKITQENYENLSTEEDKIISPPFFDDIQPPDSPLTYTPEPNTADDTPSCSYKPSPIKEDTVIITTESEEELLPDVSITEEEHKKYKTKESKKKCTKSGHSSEKGKHSLKSKLSSIKEKKKITSDKHKSSSSKISDDKLKNFKKSLSKDNNNLSQKTIYKTSPDKIKSKHHIELNLKLLNPDRTKSSNEDQKKYKHNKDSNNENKSYSSDDKIKHKQSEEKIKSISSAKSSSAKSSTEKSSSEDKKRYKHNRHSNLENKSSLSKSSGGDKRKHNQDSDYYKSRSSTRSSGEKRKRDQHKEHKPVKKQKSKHSCDSSSSDIELVAEKSPCILIDSSNSSIDEEIEDNTFTKKPKLSVSGGSLPFQNLGPSTSRLSLSSISTSFSERWRKAKEQVQRPQTAGKIKISSVPNVSSLLDAKDKLLALTQKPNNQPVAPYKLSLKENMASPTIKQRIAHKTAINLPKCLTDPAIKLPYAPRQLCLNTMYEACLQYLPEKEAKVMAQSTELDIAKRVNVVKTYQNSMALAVLKIRKTKGEDGKKEEEELTAQSIPDYTYGLSLYECFSKYLLSKEEIVQNGYPLVHDTEPGCAYIDPSARRYSIKQPDDPNLRICLHCKKLFNVDSDGYPTTEYDCSYHHGKLYKVKERGTILERYRCCAAEVGAEPCVLGRYHISSTLDENCMPDFVKSHSNSVKPQIYGLDCEMCYTKNGLELARCTMLGIDGKVVIDTTVLPSSKILDYCTRYSGLTESIMNKCTTTFKEFREKLMSLISKNTIIVGHSLENDFKVMKIVHDCVVDTSVVFPHKMGFPRKMALRSLVKDHLNMNIQESEEGHDSREDALATIDLMLWKIKQDSKKRKPRVIISLDDKVQNDKH